MEKTTSIKFYYNGIKVNGGKLRKCFYSLHDDGSVSVYADDYGTALPRDLFPVKNDTDIYTDYFDKDSTQLSPSHPLYKYAYAAAVKASIKGKERHIKSTERYIEKHPRYTDHYRKEIEKDREQIASLSKIEIEKGQPTAEDLAKIEQERQEEENARIQKEHEEQIRAREEMLNARCEGRKFIEQKMREYPIKEGAPIVRICWSEHPVFASWDDDALTMSVAAAEIVLKKYDDEEHAKDAGYCKTKFRIEWTEDGEPNSYEGRYDLGDGDGGMISHIRSFGEWNRTHTVYGHEITDANREENAEHIGEAEHIIEIAEWLKSFTVGGNIVKVEASDWLKLLAERKKQETMMLYQKAKESIQFLSVEQLEMAIRRAEHTPEGEFVMRFFLQELDTRDHDRAYKAFNEWKEAK